MHIDLLKQKLEQEKLNLESEMEGIGRRNPLVPNDWEPTLAVEGSESDLIDHASTAMDRENTRAIFADLEARYDSVLAALTRVEKGTYGVCGACGAAIDEARLAADPAARNCTKHL